MHDGAHCQLPRGPAPISERLPANSATDDNYDVFMHSPGNALSLMKQHPGQFAYIAGDFNACTKRSSLFGRELEALCTDNNLVISDLHMLCPDSLTYLSESPHTTSWLDHQRIAAMSVDDSFQSSDHFPLLFTVRCPC